MFLHTNRKTIIDFRYGRFPIRYMIHKADTSATDAASVSHPSAAPARRPRVDGNTAARSTVTLSSVASLANHRKDCFTTSRVRRWGEDSSDSNTSTNTFIAFAFSAEDKEVVSSGIKTQQSLEAMKNEFKLVHVNQNGAYTQKLEANHGTLTILHCFHELDG